MRMTASVAILGAGFVTGCWSGPTATELLVDTTPPGAACVVSQPARPSVTTAPTPAIALVDPAGGAVGILCRRDGFADTRISVPAAPGAPPPGFVANRPPDIAYDGEVLIPLAPAPPGLPPAP